jgi:hypothetical protein
MREKISVEEGIKMYGNIKEAGKSRDRSLP